MRKHLPVRADLVLYTQGWNGDRSTDDGELPDAQIYGRLFVNDFEIPGFLNARVLVRQGEFLTVTLRVMPATIQVVPLANIKDLDSRLPTPESFTLPR